MENSSSTEMMIAFQMALRKVMQVSKSDLNKALAKDRAAREEAYAAGKPKRGPKPKITTPVPQ